MGANNELEKSGRKQPWVILMTIAEISWKD
jgi:hypothetical protein